MKRDNAYNLTPALQWIDSCSEHAAANPESLLHHVTINSDGTIGSPNDDAYAWRSVLADNRAAGDDLPAPWRRIYFDMMLVAFDNDPTIRATWVGERQACLVVEWSHVNGLNVDVEMELRSRSTCPICGKPARTVRVQNSHVTRCEKHLTSV